MKKKITLLFVLAAGLTTTLSSCKKMEGDDILAESEAGRCIECDNEKFISVTGDQSEVMDGNMFGREIQYVDMDGQHVMEGDIIVSDADLNGTDEKGNITTKGSRLWPNNRVFYRFSSNVPKITKDRFKAAIKHWERHTKLRFVLKTKPNQKNWIQVVNSTGCWSFIGRQGGRQDLGLSTLCSKGNAIHEIGHAIGLFHEHSRKDRNNFVKILSQNIQTGKAHNFSKCSSCTDVGNLDFNSIMMYGPYFFSKNGKPTIRKKNNQLFNVQRNRLSNRDKQIIALKYK